MTTIFEKLLGLGYTEEEIRTAATEAENQMATRTFSIALSETPDQYPIVGIAYRCDYRAEEEWGVAELQKALGGSDAHAWRMDRDGRNHVGHFTGHHSLILSKHEIPKENTWGYHIPSDSWREAARGSASEDEKRPYAEIYYNDYYSTSLPWTQGISNSLLHWEKMDALKAMHETLHIPGSIPRKKADLVAKIEKSAEYLASATNPNIWPGWFHFGDTIVFRADRGIVADVLDLLWEAADEGHLAYGGGGIEVFGSSMGFYDARDVGRKLCKQRKAYNKWYDAAMKCLEPVQAELKRRGYNWYFLGKPCELSPQGRPRALYYWLNGTGVRMPDGSYKQPFGWYTLTELLDEQFIKDLHEKVDA